MGISSAIKGFLISQAYRKAEATFVVPFEYIAMPPSIFWGILVFNTTLDLQFCIGICMIIVSGLYIIWRETIRGQTALARSAETPRFRW